MKKLPLIFLLLLLLSCTAVDDFHEVRTSSQVEEASISSLSWPVASLNHLPFAIPLPPDSAIQFNETDNSFTININNLGNHAHWPGHAFITIEKLPVTINPYLQALCDEKDTNEKPHTIEFRLRKNGFDIYKLQRCSRHPPFYTESLTIEYLIVHGKDLFVIYIDEEAEGDDMIRFEQMIRGIQLNQSIIEKN